MRFSKRHRKPVFGGGVLVRETRHAVGTDSQVTSQNNLIWIIQSSAWMRWQEAQRLANDGKTSSDQIKVEFPGVGHAPALMDDAQIAIVRDWLAGGLDERRG